MENLKEKTKSSLKWILFLLVIFVFIKIAKRVFIKEIFIFDGIIYHFLVSMRSYILNGFFKVITNMGSALVLAIVTALCVIFIRDKKYKLLVPVNLAIIAGLNIILKNIFVRQRPNQLRLIEEKGYSFPSGHAMACTAFYGLLIYIAYKKIQNKLIRNTICIILAILIILIDISRIYVGVHYTSDVLAGTCFSIAYLIIITKLIYIL